MVRRISLSLRAAASLSNPTACANARRACSSVEVPQRAARRRNAAITAASMLRITIWLIDVRYNDIDIDAIREQRVPRVSARLVVHEVGNQVERPQGVRRARIPGDKGVWLAFEAVGGN